MMRKRMRSTGTFLLAIGLCMPLAAEPPRTDEGRTDGPAAGDPPAPDERPAGEATEREPTPSERTELRLLANRQRELVGRGRAILSEMEAIDLSVYAWAMAEMIREMERSAEELRGERPTAEAIDAQRQALDRSARMLDGLKKLLAHMANDPSHRPFEPDRKGDKEVNVDEEGEAPLATPVDELRLLRIFQAENLERTEEAADEAASGEEPDLEEVIRIQRRIAEITSGLMTEVAPYAPPNRDDGNYDLPVPFDPEEGGGGEAAADAASEEDPFAEEDARLPDMNTRLIRRGGEICPAKVIRSRDRVDYLQGRIVEAIERLESEEEPLADSMREGLIRGIAQRQNETIEEYVITISRIDEAALKRDEPQRLPGGGSGGGGGGGGSGGQSGSQQTGGSPGNPASDAYNDRWGLQYDRREGEEGESAPWGRLPRQIRVELRNVRPEEVDPEYQESFRRYMRTLDEASRGEGEE